MQKIYHDLITYLSTPQGIMDLLKILIPFGALIYAIKKFSLDYRKPKFNILAIQTEINYYAKGHGYCHLGVEVFNPASFENTAYLEVTTLYNKSINPFFYPKEERPKIVIPANGHTVKYFTVYTNCSKAYVNKWLKVQMTDSKGKKTSKYIRWKTTST